MKIPPQTDVKFLTQDLSQLLTDQATYPPANVCVLESSLTSSILKKIALDPENEKAQQLMFKMHCTLHSMFAFKFPRMLSITGQSCNSSQKQGLCMIFHSSYLRKCCILGFSSSCFFYLTPEMCVEFPGTGVRGDYKLPVLIVRDTIKVLWKNTRYSTHRDVSPPL